MGTTKQKNKHGDPSRTIAGKPALSEGSSKTAKKPANFPADPGVYRGLGQESLPYRDQLETTGNDPSVREYCVNGKTVRVRRFRAA